ncbi:uncharacterized protein LOC133176126 [Saccostrea echinata]|uniref:uncharacterized protein LOC133176126 n=1 Tax=Saccostrea echinata TaxID=191078 RepID=UPI002A7EF28E|nr:uncharacterized protein LOC133176126 [Saccostrea echinata]
MKVTNLQVILVLMSGSLTIVIAQDPCSASVYTELGDLAKRSPTYVQDAVPVCDRYIDKKWYRAGFHQMTTSAPSLGFCGTLYPYWMNDSLPDSGQIKNVKVCQVGFSSVCSKDRTIRVKSCGNFYVYELTPLDLCNSAYCFESDISCVSEVPSSITVAYHSVSWTTEEKPPENGIKQKVHEPDINLICQFQRLADQNLFYDITWYVDNTEVLRNQTISSNASDVALLSGTQILAKGKKANSMIHCVVGAKFNEGGSPCETNASSLFFAGIKILTPILRISRGQTAEVKLQFTIPFINQNLIITIPGTPPNDEQSKLNIQMAVHNSSSRVCDDPNRKSCDTEVNAYKYKERDKYNTDDWKVVHEIKVQNKHDGDFKLIDKHITLRFETGSTNGPGSKIWEDITLPDIQVYIEDSDSAWKGKNCESHTDPHMKTFDGKYYECQMDGTFILYRNKIYQQEVQEKHHKCYHAYNYPRCTCAVAVRSGKDVFIVDICNTQTIINFPTCEDKVLKVIKTSDKLYKVIFPTGTLVEIRFVSWPTQDHWQLNIDIFPSPSDVGNSSGLCGILDNNYRNDFTWNNPGKTEDIPDLYDYYNPPNGFSNSWRVGNGEVDLFDNSVYDNLDSITTVFDRTCTCEREDNQQKGDIICSYGNYKNCKFVVGKKYYCILNPEGQLRRKRDLRHLQSLRINDPGGNVVQHEHSLNLLLVFFQSRVKRQTNIDMVSHENATIICHKAFEASDSYLMCQEHVSDLANTSLVNCISDVMMTGDINITKIHIEAALEQCSTFVVLNSTFQEVEPDITYRIESLCENNCSGNGICNTGNCTCNSGYAGSDCSFDLSGPPSITHISDFGICDKSSEACDEITLYGKYFLENMNTTCYLRRKTLAENGTVLSETNYESSLQERTLFEGYCPLNYNTDDNWVTEFRFNVSNDGSRYTDNYNIYTYQSLCQKLKNDTGNITFIFKDGYCYINNTCVADGDTNKDNVCDICNTASDKYQWSFNTGHCFINGKCFTAGAINETNPCSVCNPSLNITAWSPNPGFCFIDSICYFDGQVNPRNNCDVCQSNVSRSDWIFNEGYCLIDGLCIKNGVSDATMDCKMCNSGVNKTTWQIKNGHCIIDGQCFKHGENQTSVGCKLCDPLVKKDNWTLAKDYCLLNGSCVIDGEANSTHLCDYCDVSTSKNTWTKNPGYCYIDGLCVRDGERNMSNDCFYCNTSKGQKVWSFNPGYCYIDGMCVLDGERNISNECYYCNTSKEQNVWSFNPGYCNIESLCIADGQKNVSNECFYCNTSQGRDSWSFSEGYCYIDGMCVRDGERNMSNECYYCNTSKGQNVWSFNPDYCNIESLCIADGQTNVSNECFYCNTSQGRDSWSFSEGYCYIDGLCVRDGERNVSNECYYCNTSKGHNFWSFSPEYCLIDGTCIKEGRNHTKFGCKICDPLVNTSEWTLTQDYCFIADTCILDGNSNITYPCQFCNVSNGMHSWSQNPGYCIIADKCVSHGEKNISSPCDICDISISNYSWSKNQDFCKIGELCVANGERNATNECFYCNATLGHGSWSFREGYCNIDEKCIKEGEIHTLYSCKVCDTTQDKGNWTIVADYCLINDMCVRDGELNKTYPCDVCNISLSRYTWSPNNAYCEVDNMCIPNGQKNSSSECFYCNTSLGRSVWSLIQDCPLTTKVQTTSTAEPTTTVQITSTSEPTTTRQTTSTSKPTTTRQTTSTTEPTTTRHTTSTSEPTTTRQTTSTTEPTTTRQTTSTNEPTTTRQTTSTSEPTTTRQTTSTNEPTTTRQTASTTEPSTTSTTEPTTTSTTEGTSTIGKSTTTTQDRMTTSSCVEMNIENITVTYYDVSWNTSIKTEGATKRTIHDPSVNLKCNFTSSSDNLLFYKVEWYVDKHILVKSEVLGGSTDKYAILSLYDLISMNKKSGIQVLCKVGATKDKLMAPCEMFESDPFLAGMMMNDTKLSLPRKGKAHVGFYLTVPFVTQTVILNDTVQALHPLTVHSNIIPMSENGCKGSIGVDQCSVEISAYSYNEKNRYESNEWRKVHYITVYHIDTDGYSIDTTATLYLRTSENEDGFFHNISLDNTSIQIFEAKEIWKGKSCGSKTDPHLYTFDGVAFESHIEGEFILYRNSLYNQEIQTRHEKCHTNYPFPQCTCAVSVQSGNDVFMIDICGNNNFMDFLRCQDNVIEVYKITDKLYKVLLPTGTTVIVSLVEWPVEGSWQIDIDIYPSLADANNTDGLCGTLDGDRGNEFTHRNGSSDSSALEYPDNFSRSWMVQNDENLLNSAPSDRPPISSNLDKICTCSPSGNQCSYHTYSQCSKATGKQYYCTQTANQIQSLRKKREVHLNSNLPSLHDRHKRAQSIYVRTETEAENVCKSAFNSSEPFQTCRQYVSDMTNASLSNCIMDVRLTGDENITAIHIEAALKQCVNFLDLNTTLKTEQPDVTYQLQSLCSNNCSGHGICKDGNCTCDFGFGGSDCAFNVRAPPTILRTAPNGTCDMSLRTCSEVLLEGRYFLQNINKTCFITRILIHYDDTVMDTKGIEQPLDDRTLFQGACPLPDDRRTKWITKFTFNISYDGKQFTQTYSVYKYQSECQEVSYDRGVEQFSLKAGYCFIDNKCVRRETSNPGNSCEVCSPSSQKFDWSLHKDCVSTTLSPTTKSPISSPAFIITVSAVSFIFVVTLIVVILVWRYRSSTGRHLNEVDSTKGLELPKWRTYFDEGK